MPNTPNLTTAIAYLHSVVNGRLKVHFGREETVDVSGVGYVQDDSSFAKFLEMYHPGFEEYVVLLLALVPHLQPDFFSTVIADFLPEGGDFAPFGGARSGNHRGIMPTGETAQFILADDDLAKRLSVQALFSTSHWFYQQHILTLEPVRPGEPMMSGRIILDSEVVELLTVGLVSKPKFSTDFPAEYLQTPLEWEDLVLHPQTLRQIRDIENWITWNPTLLEDWGMKRHIRQGYRALFYGPPGTGKTLTATLLGKATDKDVFRIDLSQTISKYIGETEKNLSRLFDKAQNKDWILFFDEADALFGKRTDIRDAHDKYANQEVAYLLQRIESFAGLVILASNQRNNIDEAFARRFQSMIYFPMPRVEERLSLWQKAIPEQLKVDKNVDWVQIATRFELTGASIGNIVHYCLLTLLADKNHVLDHKRLENGIMRELVKEGKLT
ncbi:ATP-binding protein [Runella sp.]|uniref:ATP-binding protein n=1 Tax=Runella sp. TaxID=1960881 RepID=UPI003D138CC6